MGKIALPLMKTALLLLILVLWALISSVHGEMYKWVDEKGTVHFTDDPSSIPEKYRTGTETRKTPKETQPSETGKKPSSDAAPPSARKAAASEGIEVDLFRKGDLWITEVTFNNRVRRHLLVDTGASFTLISRDTANELGIVIDDRTPFIYAASVSDLILLPLVNLETVRVGDAEVENVEVVIYNMPSGTAGLLGNSFLNNFRVGIDSVNQKLTLYPLKGEASPDRPGGYGRDYWIGKFRFYNRNLENLKRLKVKYEGRGSSPELNRINNAIRYFENQLGELERKASFAGVPRTWRE